MKQLLLMPDARNIGGIRDKAMFMLICETGIKVSELVSLRVDDLRLKEKCVLIRRQDLMLKVEINEEVCRCLRAYLASRELFYPKTSDMLFLNVYGRTITRQGVWKTLKKYADHADMKGITLETLRRSFAHRFLDSGKDIRSLRKILGHSDVAITRAYVKG
jgi:integrase/recombinase XerD